MQIQSKSLLRLRLRVPSRPCAAPKLLQKLKTAPVLGGKTQALGHNPTSVETTVVPRLAMQEGNASTLPISRRRMQSPQGPSAKLNMSTSLTSQIGSLGSTKTCAGR